MRTVGHWSSNRQLMPLVGCVKLVWMHKQKQKKYVLKGLLIVKEIIL